MLSDGFAIRAGYLHNQDKGLESDTLNVPNLLVAIALQVASGAPALP